MWYFILISLISILTIIGIEPRYRYSWQNIFKRWKPLYHRGNPPTKVSKTTFLMNSPTLLDTRINTIIWCQPQIRYILKKINH